MFYQQKKYLAIGIFLLFCIGTIIPNITANTIKNNKIRIETSQEEYEYIILTSNYFENSYFQYLLDHKSQYLSTKMVFIEDIINNPDYKVKGKYGDATNEKQGNPFIPEGKEVVRNFDTFDDTQARIRNFLRFAKTQWKTKYVLLGGDVQFIPVRKLRINETLWYTGISSFLTFANIRADFYYAALNGTFNDDFDEHFGEASDYSISDEADFEAELFIGRAPVDDKREVKIFVEKLISFETSEKPKNILLHQSGLNSINIPDSSVVPNKCLDHIPIDEYDVYLLYQINTFIPVAKYANNWKNPDKLIVLHVGSGENAVYYTQRSVAGDEKFTIEEIPRLDNTFFPVHMSVSCNSGNFGLDHDCLAEKMLLYPDGGPSACIFNSFYGVASENNAHKYSGEFIESQFIEIFEKGTDKLGEIVTKSKYQFTDKAKNELLYRWCYYTVYLLGDPETSLFEVRNKISIINEAFVDDDFNSATPGWGSTHFDNIQDAINAVYNSGIINVNSGTYNENININKPVSLIGENKETTIINGNGYGTVININDETTITGFTIKNSGSSQNDAGIKINSNLNIIKDNTFTDNHFGLKISNYVNNSIFNNNFYENQQNCYDSGENRWFGNYFDDYTGKDSNEDGIGDSSYLFTNGKDYCPFINKDGWLSGVNHPPIKPTISGPSRGRPYGEYYYNFHTADPDGDNIYYFIDMGDGAYREWSGPFSSSEIKTIGYYYENKGSYIIRVKAKDSNGLETDLESLIVTMPRVKNIETTLLTKIIEIFPHFYRIMQQLLNK